MNNDRQSARRRPAISVIVPVFNGAEHLHSCLQSLKASQAEFECIVVDDGSTDTTAEIARSSNAVVLSTGSRKGPAFARNLGAASARADLLLFIDADVCVQPDSLSRVLRSFKADPEQAALFGSYDDTPAKQDFLSQYRNLMHHFVHQRSRHEAQTFWSGFGAIRRRVFEDHSGFDTSYSRPSIEDIELGNRLHRSGCKIILDPELQVKHLKEWSFWGVIRTDVQDRAVPWTELMLRDGAIPNDLNVSISQRISVALAFILIAVAVISSLMNSRVFLAPLLAILFLLLGQYQVEITTGRRFKRSIVTGILIAALAVASFWSGQPLILVVSLLAFLLLIFRRHYYTPEFPARHWVAVFSGVFLVGAIAFVALQPAANLSYTLLLTVAGLLIVLNARFYVLLASKRGRMYAVAAFPFHVLFFFYSGTAFLIGFFRYHLSKWFGGKSKSEAVGERVSDKVQSVPDHEVDSFSALPGSRHH